MQIRLLWKMVALTFAIILVVVLSLWGLFHLDHHKVVKTLGTIAMLISLAMVFVGLPSQMIKNYRTKTAGLSVLLAIVAYLAYTIWTFYALMKPDWFLLVCQGTGSLVGLALLIQTVYYSLKNKPNT